MCELLAPAGGPRQLEAAVRFGADSVYFGLGRFGLRQRADNFDEDKLSGAVAYAHEGGARALLTLNIFAYDDDLPEMIGAARLARTCGIDAVIMSDPGAIAAVREALPDLDIHLSTQANTMNSSTARLFHSLGVSRIVLSRELSLDRIRAMRDNLPPSLELEAFVHGAACMSHSGRCSLSRYMTGRDANRGDCSQPCRWRYRLEEEKRPGEYMPVTQTERGVEIFSAGDLLMIGHIDALARAGVSCFKIEGRMKNEYYVATVTGAYRRALDALADGKYDGRLIGELQEELNKVSHRPYDTGFYLGAPERPGGVGGLSQTMEFVGRVTGCQGRWAEVETRGRLELRDKLELMSPGLITEFVLDEMADADGKRIDSCVVPKSTVRVKIPCAAAPGDLLRGTCRNHRASE